MIQRKMQNQITTREEPAQKTVLKERDVLREYPFTSAWLRKQRGLSRRGVHEAGPPFVRVGRMVFYRRQAIDEWLRRQEIGGTKP
jgi:hypothetical protein